MARSMLAFEAEGLAASADHGRRWAGDGQQMDNLVAS